jgi:hypothetical protein
LEDEGLFDGVGAVFTVVVLPLAGGEAANYFVGAGFDDC